MPWRSQQVVEVDADSLQALRRRSDETIDRIVPLLAEELDVPVCAVLVLDTESEWILSGVGVQRSELHRAFSLSELDLDAPVEDARRHPILSGHPWVEATPQVRSLMVAPIDIEGRRVGSLVAMDVVLRTFDEEDYRHLLVQRDIIAALLHHRQRAHELAQWAEERDAFAKRLVHALAGPSRRSAMCAKLAREALNEGDVASVNTYMGFVEEQSGQALSLLAALSRYAQDRKPVDIELSSVEKAAEVAWRTSGPERATLVMDLQAGTGVRAHPVYLRAVLTELFHNSDMHGGEGLTRVRVQTVADDDNRLAVLVTDDGVGIPDQARALMLRPLMRGAGLRAENTGMGLAEVVQWVGAWGGEVELLDRPDASGLTVRFTEAPPGAETGSPPKGPARP